MKVIPPILVSGIVTAIMTICSILLGWILLLAKRISPSGTRRIWHAKAADLVRSGTISSCDTITCISRTPFDLVISFATGEMIVISRSDYYFIRWTGFGKWIPAGKVLDQDYM